MSLQHTARNLLHLVSATMVGRFISLLVLPVTLRVFLPSEYAKLSLYTTVVQMAGIFVNLPASAIGRFGREEFVQTGHFTRTFWTVHLIRLPLLLIILAGLLVFRRPLLSFMQLPASMMGLVMAALVIGFTVGLSEMLQAEERFATASWLMLVPGIINAGIVLLAAFGRLPARGTTLVWSAFLGTVVTTLLLYLSLRKRIGRPVVDVTRLRGILVFVWPFFFHWLGVYGLDYMDAIILRRYMPMTVVGTYAVAYNLNLQIRAPILSLSPLIFPRLTSLYLAQATEKVEWFYRRILPQLALFAAQFVCLLLLSQPLVGLFLGARFQSAVRPLTLLLGGLGFHATTILMIPMFYAAKRTIFHTAAYLGMAAVNLALDFLLVPHWGMMGAAAGKIGADVTGVLLHAFFFRRLFGQNPLPAIVWSLPVWLLTAAILWGLPWAAQSGLWLSATALCLLGARQRNLFDEASASFFEKLGLPLFLQRYSLGFYRHWLIRRPPHPGM